MARSMKSVDEMANAMTEYRDRDGYTRKLYKVESDEHKAEFLQADIKNRINALKENETREKINFSDVEQVKRRTYEYLEACEQAAVYPSVMGLAVHGFGVSRQALNQYLLQHPSTPTTRFISLVKDSMADILTNAALYRNADNVSVIFQLKNHFQHADRVELAPVEKNDPLGPALSEEELAAKFSDIVVDEESQQ